MLLPASWGNFRPPCPFYSLFRFNIVRLYPFWAIEGDKSDPLLWTKAPEARRLDCLIVDKKIVPLVTGDKPITWKGGLAAQSSPGSELSLLWITLFIL